MVINSKFYELNLKKILIDKFFSCFKIDCYNVLYVMILQVKSAVAPLHELSLLEELAVHGNPLFRTAKSYRDSLPELPALRLLEGHPVNSKQ